MRRRRRGACGEDRDAHAAFVAEADAICKTANDKEAALGAEGSGWLFGEQFDDAEFGRSTTPGASPSVT